MSCQQVPRLAEDPYTFTETPITTAYFTSPIQKLSSIKSANQLPNHPKYLAAPPQQLNRFNGTSNGVGQQKQHHVPIYAKQPVYQQEQQQQHPRQYLNPSPTTKLTAPKTVALNIPPLPISSPADSSFASIRKIVENKQLQSISSSSPPSSSSHPPQTNQTKTKTKQLQNNLNHSNVQNTSSASIVSSTASFVPIQSYNNHVHQQQRQQQQQQQNFHTSHHEALQRIPQRANVNGVAKANAIQKPVHQQRTLFKSQNQPKLLQVTEQPIASKTIKLNADKKDNDSSIATSINGFSAPSIPAPTTKINGIGKGKKQINAEKKAFAKPKSEAKTAKSTKKMLNSAKSQPNGKRKRSYSQTSHHEALQRIPLPVNMNGIAAASITANCISGHEKADLQKKLKREWHAPESYLYDDPSLDLLNDQLDVAACSQAFWFRDILNENLLTREQRLETKRDNLRRQAFQYAQAQNFRSTSLAKRRLMTVAKALIKFKEDRNKITMDKCGIPSCSNDALAMTAYCYLHITLNTDQKLFHPCTAKFSDNSQCRVPVFDISHELPLCREHAWKRDNYNRMVQEQKPKKSVRKKAKPAAINRTPKRNKKKKKQEQQQPQPQPQQQQQPQEQQLPVQHIVQKQQQLPSLIDAPFQKQLKLSNPVDNLAWNHDLIGKVDNFQMLTTKTSSITSSINNFLSDNVTMYQFANSVPSLTKLQQHEILSVCENSSAYESSEDTGVGGLSESELIGAPDGIEIPLGDARLLEEHDLTNVLNQLPEDAFNELFEVQQNDHYEPTQKEQDELARALEEVDEQVKSLEQMTGSSDFLENFLNVDDEILVDGSDICTEVLTTTASVQNDIRGLVHT